MILKKVNSHIALASKGLHQASKEGDFWQPDINKVGFWFCIAFACKMVKAL